MPKRTKRNYRVMVWTTFLVVALDQISKWWVTQRLQIYESFPVIEGVFDLVHIRNRGMAFGLLNGPHADFRFWFLLLTSLTAVAILLIWFFRLKTGDTWTTLAISLVLGGAVGNLIDRIRYREVVDFLDFYFRSYHWPAFNVADAAITAGTCLLVITLLFRRPHGE